MNATHRETRSGFTLIELLVVIAIIAILAAILFPVFAQAKEAAKKTSCLSNFKEIATAEKMYQGDFDDAIQELIPGGCTTQAGAVGEPSMWMGTLQAYEKSQAIHQCPSSSLKLASLKYADRATNSVGFNSFLGLYDNYYYWKNYPNVCYVPGDPGAARAVTDSLIGYSSQTVMIADAFDLTVNGVTPRGYWIDPGYGVGRRFGLSDRHSGGSKTPGGGIANLAFTDTHVKSLKVYSVLNQGAIDTPGDTPANNMLYIAKSNYNAAGVIWDVDAPNPQTNPGLYPTNCCTNP